MNQTIKLDTRKCDGAYGKARIATLRRGERNNALLTVKVCANGQPYDLAGKTASLVATTAAGKLVGPCPMEVAEAGIARIMLPAALYSAVGSFSGYVEIREGDTLVDTTDRFGGKVIECADLDSEQAAEFTPLLGELQNAVAEEAKRVEAEKARAQAETERVKVENERVKAEEKRAQDSKTRLEELAQAKTNAETATGEANTARDEAKKAATDATSAAGRATDAAGLAETAKTNANTAAEEANAAATKAEAAARKADGAAETAGTAASTAEQAANKADTAAGNAESMAEKADASANKADIAAGKANEATVAATNAATKANEVEAKLTVNILKGKVKETFVHVDDAFPSSLLGIDVEGSCKQDGTPSPDNPVPIEVVENPVVMVTGRNLLDIHEGMPESDCNKDSEPSTKRIIKPGTYVLGLTSNNYLSNFLENVQIGNGAVSFTPTVHAYGIGFGVSLVPGVTYKFGAQGNAELRFAFYSADGTWLSHVTTSTPTVPINAVYSVLVLIDTGIIEDVVLRDIYGAATQITYEPYVGTSTPFTLPPEHPYLAKLPDGTADTIEVDKDGNVELVARVSKATIETSQKQPWGKGYSIYDWPNDGRYSSRLSSDGNAIFCDKIKAESAANIYRGNGIGISVGSIFAYDKSCVTVFALGDGVDVSSIDGAVLYYPLMTERRYPLGKIEMPKAQDSIINVWTDAEVTPRTGIEYVRDVNIVVDNLESAIASITES